MKAHKRLFYAMMSLASVFIIMAIVILIASTSTMKIIVLLVILVMIGGGMTAHHLKTLFDNRELVKIELNEWAKHNPFAAIRMGILSIFSGIAVISLMLFLVFSPKTPYDIPVNYEGVLVGFCGSIIFIVIGIGLIFVARKHMNLLP